MKQLFSFLFKASHSRAFSHSHSRYPNPVLDRLSCMKPEEFPDATKSLIVCKQIHCLLVKWPLTIWPESKILSMYMDNGFINEGRSIFTQMDRKDVYSWLSSMKLEDFRDMTESLIVCKQIHCCLVKRPLTIWAENKLLSMYMDSGFISEGMSIFTQMDRKNAFSYTTMMQGFAWYGPGYAGLKMLKEMIQKNFHVSDFGFIMALKCCKDLYHQCEPVIMLHGQLIRRGFNNSPEVVYELLERSLWNFADSKYQVRALGEIAHQTKDTGPKFLRLLAWHGLTSQAFQLFEYMERQGIPPTSEWFLSLLYACSHTGTLEEGLQVYEDMVCIYQIKAKPVHDAAFVDMLSRAGMFSEALSFINKRPPQVSFWRVIVSGAVINNNLSIGLTAADKILEISGPDDTGAYMAKSILNAQSGNWVEVYNVRELITSRKLEKKPGLSGILVEEQVW